MTIQILSKDNIVFSTDDIAQPIEKNNSPFKEIIAREPLNDFRIVIDDDDYSFENLLDLAISVKKTGTFHSFIPKTDFDEKTIVSQLKKLKAAGANDEESALSKAGMLLDILLQSHIVFVFFDPIDDSLLSVESAMNLFQGKIPFVFAEATRRADVGEEVSAASKTVPSNEKGKTHETIIDIFKGDKFLFLSLLFDGLLIDVTASLFTQYIKTDNVTMIVITTIFFVVGNILFTLATYDFLKSSSMKTKKFLIMMIVTFIGMLLGIGTCIGMYYWTNSPTKYPDILPLPAIWSIGFAVSIVSVSLFVGVSYFARKIAVKRKTK